MSPTGLTAQDSVLMVGSGNDVHAVRPLNWLLDQGCRVTFVDNVNPLPNGRPNYSFRYFPSPIGRHLVAKLFPHQHDRNKPSGFWLRKLKSLARKIGQPITILVTSLLLKRLCRQTRPAITHVHWVDIRAYFCLRAGFRPLVLSVWGSDINRLMEPEADPVLARYVGKALAGADRILIDSSDMHEKCARLAGHPVRTEMFALGIDTARFRPGYAEEARCWRQSLNIPDGARVLVSMRGWSPTYRQLEILEAFATAAGEFKVPAVLVFKVLPRPVPGDRDYAGEVRQRESELDISKSVRWMDTVPMKQLPEIYALADAVINFPSMDGFPITFLEAGACQCPVITARLPAYVGTFAEQYFRLVSDHDLTDLARSIVQFVNSDEGAARRRLGELRQLICRNYDERICSRRLIDLYNGLAAA